MTETDAVFAHPARVMPQLATDDAERWMSIVVTRRAFDPTVFDSRRPFFWSAEISNSRLDTYFTNMAPSTLRNFAQGANDGVSFQNSHRWMELPLGQSVEGVFDEAEARALATFYTIPGLNMNGVDTTQFIDGLRAGIVHDVSVGFYGGQFMCSICGRDMMADVECAHWPGFQYMVGEGEASRKVLATARVENALLSEVSAVFDGATPGAGVMKAQRELEAGRLGRRQIEMLEQRYRVRLVGGQKHYGGAAVPEPDVIELEDKRVTKAADQAAPDANVAQVREIESARAILQRAGAGGDSLTDEATWVAETIAELRLLADDGRRYRQDLIGDAMTEGTRAMGEQFDAELYRGLLATAGIPQIRALRDQWRTMGDNQFAGGPVVRSSNEPPAKEAPEAPARANQAYK